MYSSNWTVETIEAYYYNNGISISGLRCIEVTDSIWYIPIAITFEVELCD